MDGTIENMLLEVSEAKQRLEDKRSVESEARRSATAAENALNEALKKAAEYIVRTHPTLANAIAKRLAR